jgi:addiction module RelE/StbE family toxin
LKPIRWTPAAAVDLQQIGEYLKEHNPSFAKPTVERLYEATQSLTRFPSRGRLGQVLGTRELVVSPLPYIIVYQVMRTRFTFPELYMGHKTGRAADPLHQTTLLS